MFIKCVDGSFRTDEVTEEYLDSHVRFTRTKSSPVSGMVPPDHFVFDGTVKEAHEELGIEKKPDDPKPKRKPFRQCSVDEKLNRIWRKLND